MLLEKNGIDIFYIDESEQFPLSVATSVRVPFLRKTEDGTNWQFVYEDYLDAATKWRRDISQNQSVRFRQELHGYELLNRRGLYHRTRRNLTVEEARETYRFALTCH